MIKVFLDTNIAIDIIEDRGEFTHQAAIIMQLAAQGVIELFASDVTFVNVAYTLRKREVDKIYDALDVLKKYIKVLGASDLCIQLAINERHKDFEDCVQYHIALSEEMDCIVTRNEKDFVGFNIDVYSPREFLDMMNIEY